MTFLAFLFILISLVTFVAAQLILKRAMEFSATHGMRNSYFGSRVAIGVVLMTVSFFLTLGLLQRFDLSYLYPFQGLSVIFITILAAVVLKEKLSVRLAIGALLVLNVVAYGVLSIYLRPLLDRAQGDWFARRRAAAGAGGMAGPAGSGAR